MNIIDVLSQHFNLDELQGLTHDLGIDHEEIPSNTKAEFVRELVRYADRHQLTDDLILHIENKRPFLSSTDIEQLTDKKDIQQKKISNKGNGMKSFLKNWELIVAFIVVMGTLITTAITQWPVGTSNNRNILYTISIIDSENGEPINQASVVISFANSAPLSNLTDQNGNVTFSIAQKDQNNQISITVRKNGYMPNHQDIQLTGENNSLQKIQLVPNNS